MAILNDEWHYFVVYSNGEVTVYHIVADYDYQTELNDAPAVLVITEDTKITWTICQLACNKTDPSMHGIAVMPV